MKHAKQVWLSFCFSLIPNRLFWAFFAGLITIHSKFSNLSTAWDWSKIYLYCLQQELWEGLKNLLPYQGSNFLITTLNVLLGYMYQEICKDKSAANFLVKFVSKTQHINLDRYLDSIFVRWALTLYIFHPSVHFVAR